MKLFIIAFAFILCGLSAFAQKTVIIQRGEETVNQYNDFNQAVVDAAQSGDIIYLSAGVYGNAVTVNKQLSIFGAGYYPNSTPDGPGYTYINNTMFLVAGSSGSHIAGIHFNNDVRISGVAADTISGIFLDRCRFLNLYLAYGTIGRSEGHIIKNCYIHHFYGHNTDNQTSSSSLNSVAANNIIRKATNFLQANLFDHNIFTAYSLSSSYSTETSLLYIVYYCNFQNNIFFKPSYNPSPCYSYLLGGNNNSFTYNMFVGFTGSGGTSNVFANNFDNVNRDILFVNYSYLFGSTNSNCHFPYFNFDYSHDYHLQPNCVGVGAGNDSTDIGIYGGSNPWKEQALPANPRITNFDVTPTVPASGIININATVEGQNR